MSTTYAAPAGARGGHAMRGLPEALVWGALLALALWAAAPIVYLLLRAAHHHESLSGGDSLFAADQLQYLSWIRSSGEHLLATNGFALRTGNAVFLHPMFVISGFLWRAGMNIALSYLLWLPVAVGVLYFGFRQFTFRMLSTPMARAAALILALFFVTPADPIAGWTVGSGGLGALAGQLAPSGALFGYFPVSVAVGLSAFWMLGIDAIVDPVGRRRSSGWYLGWTSLAGMGAAWLHPWQGETALLVIAAIVVLGRFRRPLLPLLVPAAASAIPLIYYLVLTRIDAAWKLAQVQSAGPLPSALLLVLALAPLAAFALRGFKLNRRPEAVLWLWPMAALVVYFLSPGYSSHALEGIVLPLAVLAVRGWQELRWPAWLGVIAIAAATLPGLVFNLELFHKAAVTDVQGMLLRQGETQALRYLDEARSAGGVLPSLQISAAVPAYTGRRTWIGHASWTPDYSTRAPAVSALFAGKVSGAAARSFLRQVGARYLLDDCERGFNPVWLGPLLVSEHRFGCVVVYTLSVANRAKPL